MDESSPSEAAKLLARGCSYVLRTAAAGVRAVNIFPSVTIESLLAIAGNYCIPPRRSIQLSTPYGLTLVDTKEHPRPARFDIIFVHGLGASPDTTWRKQVKSRRKSLQEGAPEDGVHWIRDLLSTDLRAARLLFFSYDSTAYNDAPRKNLEDIADELLQALQSSQLRITPTEKTRPIIFVCHSYGGLVVKKALVEARLRPAHNPDILANTRGIIFLGTPHKGTEYSQHAKSVALHLDRLGSNPDIFLPLAVNSPSLAELHEDFVKSFGELNLVNFYETYRLEIFRTPILNLPIRRLPFLEIPVRILVVDKSSATFQAPNTANHLMNADHSGLNKFGSRADEGYKKILESLRVMLREILEKARQQIESSQQPLTRENPTSEPPNIIPVEPSWKVVQPQAAKSFTERAELSSRLAECLQHPVPGRDPPYSVALTGMGGSGKSQLALRYLETHQTHYNPIIWIDARTPRTALQGFSEAFEALDLEFPDQVLDQFRKSTTPVASDSISTKDDPTVKEVLRWLKNRNYNHPQWLLVLDNADELSWVREIVARGERGSVIITSRHGSVENIVNDVVQVGVMTEKEALELLFRGVGAGWHFDSSPSAELKWKNQQIKPATDIVNKVGRLALAVDLAGSYISQDPRIQENFSLYLQHFEQNSKGVLGDRHNAQVDYYQSTVINVWETSFNAVSAINPLSAQLLIFLAFLDRTNVGDRLFIEASTGIKLQRATTVLGPLKALKIGSTSVVYFFLLTISVRLLLKKVGTVDYGFQALDTKRNFSTLQTIGLSVAICQAFMFLIIIFYLLTDFQDRVQRRKMEQPDTLLSDVEVGEFDRISIFICAYAGFANVIFRFHTFLAITVARYLGYFDIHGGSPETLPQRDGHSIPETSAPSKLLRILSGPGGPTVAVSVFVGFLTILLWELTRKSYRNADEMRTSVTPLLVRNDIITVEIAQIDMINRRLRESSTVSARVEIIVLYIRETLKALIYIGLNMALVAFLWFQGATMVRRLAERSHNNFIRSLRQSRLVRSYGESIGLLFFAPFFGLFFVRTQKYTMPTAFYNWGPQRVASEFFKMLLHLTREGPMHSPEFSKALSPLVKLGLVYRTTSEGFAMHPMVQWWAQNRLSVQQRKLWIKEALHFFESISHSEDARKDVQFQQQVVLHLIELSRAFIPLCEESVMSIIYYQRPLERLTGLLNACLKWIEAGKSNNSR